MSVELTFTASEALYEGEVIHANQEDSLTIGPFEYAQLTYDFVRVGPRVDGDGTDNTEGEHIAVWNDGVWETIGGIAEVPVGLSFSDVTIYPSKSFGE